MTLLELLTSLNPWWTGNRYDIGKPRPAYFARIERYLDTPEILVLSGVRRAGKTTLLFQIIHHLITVREIPPRNILFVSCDDPGITRLDHPIATVVDTYRKEIASEGPWYLVFDEIQSVTGWERAIKSLHDRKNYRVIITGSSSYLLDSQLSTLLSGRYLPVPVFPLDFREYLTFRGREIPGDRAGLAARKYEFITLLKEYLREGGFPGVVLQKDAPTKQDYLNAYYDSIVYRDIIRVNEVRNQRALADLLHYLFTTIAAPYSYRRLAEMLEIDISTVKDYIHFAEMAKILFEVRYFAYSLRTQTRQNRKCYCIDNGLRNVVSFRFSEDEGKLAENLVFLELLRSGEEPRYWKAKGEVDFVIKHSDNSLTAIQVSYTDTVPERERAGLQEFTGKWGGSLKERIILTKDTEKEEEGIRYVPLWKWLLKEKRPEMGWTV